MITETDPWVCTMTPIQFRAIPPDVVERVRTQPDCVEELSDGLRAEYGVESSIDFSGVCTADDSVRLIGPVVTVRYAPKRVRTNEQRLAHDRIAAALVPGAIVVVDAHDCDGSVLGGIGAAKLRAGGAAAYVVDGLARDVPEIADAGVVLVASNVGIGSGRPTVQAVQIGGEITCRGRYVCSGDVAVMNRYGLVTIPGWIDWDTVLRLIGD